MSKDCGLGLADDISDGIRHDEQYDQAHPGASACDELAARSPSRTTSEKRQSVAIASSDAKKPKRHSSKRASLRGYAEARWTRQESLRGRILHATNVAKLEWEAKAALLHHSYPLAILLLFRAASLGSAGACEQLANLYAGGVTRGASPVVTLVYRDDLRSIAWILEASRLYKRRISAQIKAASSSTSPSLRLSNIWQAPLQTVKLLVPGLLSPEVGAFDPHQKNAIFLPNIDDLTDSQCAWASRGSACKTSKAQFASELWTELEDAVQRWTAHLDSERRLSSYDSLALDGPDELEERQHLSAILQQFHFYLLVLRAIQVTRSLVLEPYAENVDPAEAAWLKASAAAPSKLDHCPDPSEMLAILASVKGKPGRIYNQQFFQDLLLCAQNSLDASVAPDYKTSKTRAVDLPKADPISAQRDAHDPRAPKRTNDRLRDLAPADVETSRQMEASARTALTMRLSSGYAAPQAAIASVQASGEQRSAASSGISASHTVREKYRRTVSSGSFGQSEPSSPTDSVCTTLSLSIARPRRPSSVVSVTPSLLFPPEASHGDREQVASDDIFIAGPSGRVRSSSSSYFASSGSVAQRPRVTSMYSSPPALITSTSSISLAAPSTSTISQHNLHAMASSNTTAVPAGASRRRTGSNASLGSLNPRLSSIMPKTSPSISEMPESSTTSANAVAGAQAMHSAAADTLRRLKGRRSHTDLRALRATRSDHSAAPPVPSLPSRDADTSARSSSLLKPSKSTVFVSLENLPDHRSSENLASGAKVMKSSSATSGSAMDHLTRTQSRISHHAIPSVLEESESNTPATAAADSSGPPFTSALAAGALSGLTVDLLFFPIDTIKTRLQSAQGFWAAGGFSGVYRGLASTAVGSAPGAAVFFTTYESMKPALVRWMPNLFGSEGTLGPAGVHMASASIAEIAACMIRVPTEVIKSRQQTMTYGKGTTTWQAFQRVFYESGVRGYYRGFGSTVGREIPFTCIQFPLYERLKLEMARSRADTSGVSDQELVRNLPTWQAGLAGSIAGAIAAGLTTPLDVVKTRIMLHTKREAASKAAQAEVLPKGVNTHIVPTLLHVGRTEGIKTLFSGFVPRTMWIGLGGAVFLGTFDAGIKTLS